MFRVVEWRSEAFLSASERYDVMADDVLDLSAADLGSDKNLILVYERSEVTGIAQANAPDRDVEQRLGLAASSGKPLRVVQDRAARREAETHSQARALRAQDRTQRELALVQLRQRVSSGTFAAVSGNTDSAKGGVSGGGQHRQRRQRRRRRMKAVAAPVHSLERSARTRILAERLA
jgi:hypothetical protein